MTCTHTYATLEVTEITYWEITRKLRAAGYDRAFDGDVIDMHGIGLIRAETTTGENHERTDARHHE